MFCPKDSFREIKHSDLETPMTSTTSDSLLSQMKASVPDAWQRFVSDYRQSLLSWLYQQGVTGHDAEEVQQRVLVKVVELLPAFTHNGQKGAFRSWLREITRNQLRSLVREKDRLPLAVGSSVSDLAERFEDPQSELSRAWDAEHSRHLVTVLMHTIEERFEAKTLAAFRASFFEGKTANQVAQELEMEPGTVRVAKSRVLSELRAIGEGMLD